VRGGGNLSKWKVGGLQVIVSGLESGGGRPKVRTKSVFQKRGRSKIIVLRPPFHAFGSGVYAPLPPAPTPWK
jgi:hypothetical protein